VRLRLDFERLRLLRDRDFRTERRLDFERDGVRRTFFLEGLRTLRLLLTRLDRLRLGIFQVYKVILR